MDNDRKQNNN